MVQRLDQGLTCAATGRHRQHASASWCQVVSQEED
jgi:hypothetical protein